MIERDVLDRVIHDLIVPTLLERLLKEQQQPAAGTPLPDRLQSHPSI